MRVGFGLVSDSLGCWWWGVAELTWGINVLHVCRINVNANINVHLVGGINHDGEQVRPGGPNTAPRPPFQDPVLAGGAWLGAAGTG